MQQTVSIIQVCGDDSVPRLLDTQGERQNKLTDSKKAVPTIQCHEEQIMGWEAITATAQFQDKVVNRQAQA